MYQIINVVDGTEYILHDQRDRELTVLEPILTLTLNKTGTLEFQILEDHMYCRTLKKLKSTIRLLEDGKTIYEGRILSDESDFYNTKNVMCEGSLAFFHDSVQRPFSITGKTPREFLEQMVKAHNEQVEERKRFVIGTVTVTDENNRADRENKGINSTWNVIKTHLLELHGGYLWVSYEDEKKVLNYTWDYGGYNKQEIRFGSNLLDLSKHQDATSIFTRVIPTGAEVEYMDKLGEKQTKTVDITSVNDGKDYLDADQSAIDEFGIITTTLNWPNITDPEKLRMKATAYLKESIQIPENLQLTALDLNYIGTDIERFKLGYYTKTISRQHNLEKELLLSKLVLHLDNPEKGSISLGGTQITLVGNIANQQANLSKTVQKVAENASAEINRKVENATGLITGGLGGYVVIDNIDPVTGKKMHPWRVLVMNTPDKDTAKNVIQINQNGIGFSTTGINGPYRNAWTIDGNLVADFITTGTMLADRIRGGTMELGGTGLGKDGSITVKDAGGNMIGSWDKTGLSILRGLLQGVSAIFGGVNNQNGAVEVLDASGRRIGRWDKDGLIISRGVIDIGNGLFYADQDIVQFGDWEVSADGSNVLRSLDGSVVIQTEQGGPFGNYAAMQIGDALITSNAIRINQVEAASTLIVDGLNVFEEIEYLKSKIKDLESVE